MKNPKVGERVAVYASERFVGTVEKGPGRITREGPEDLWLISPDDPDKHGMFGWYHPKQCRRLKPRKKPREFWINEAMIQHMGDDVATVDVTAQYPRTKFIHVREVLP